MERSERKTGIEFLRILAMMGVIVLHYNLSKYGNAFGFVEDRSFNQAFLIFLECFFIIAVDLFIMISGYFSCTSYKKNVLKPIQLIIQLIVFNVIIYIFSVIYGKNNFEIVILLKSFFPANYFVVLYCTLYLVSPFINLLLKSISKKSLKSLLFLLFLLFSVEPTFYEILVGISGFKFTGLCTIGMSGSGHGYTFINFLLCYLFGAYLRMRSSDDIYNFEKKRSLLGLIILINAFLLFVLSYFSLGLATAYCNPLVILNAFFVLEFFEKMHLKQSKVINRLAAGSFTVFLTHGYLLKLFNVQRVVNSYLILLILHIILVCIICYLFGFIIYEIYSLVTNPIYSFLKKKINFPNIVASEM